MDEIIINLLEMQSDYGKEMIQKQNITIELEEFADKLKELREKDPYKFYELKGIVKGIVAIQTGKGIEDIFSI